MREYHFYVYILQSASRRARPGNGVNHAAFLEYDWLQPLRSLPQLCHPERRVTFRNERPPSRGTRCFGGAGGPPSESPLKRVPILSRTVRKDGAADGQSPASIPRGMGPRFPSLQRRGCYETTSEERGINGKMRLGCEGWDSSKGMLGGRGRCFR